MVLRYLALIAVWMSLAACGHERPEVPAPQDPLSASALLAQMRADDVAVRRAAVSKLGLLFPDGAQVAHVLGAALQDEDAHVRKAAADSIAALASRGCDELAAFLVLDPTDTAQVDYLRAVDMIKTLGAKVSPGNLARVCRESPKAGALGFVTFGRWWSRGAWQTHAEVDDLLADLARPQEGVAKRDAATTRFCAACLAVHAARHLPPSSTRGTNRRLLECAEQQVDDTTIGRARATLRWSALRILDTIGCSSPRAVAAARTALAQGTPRTARVFREELTRILGPVPAKDHADRVKELAARLDPSRLSPRLVHTADDFYRDVMELGRIGPAAAATVSLLDALMTSSYEKGTRPRRFTVACAASLCRIDKPSGIRVGFLTTSLQPPKSTDRRAWDRFERGVSIAAPALADTIDAIPSAAMRRQVAQRALGALGHARADALEALLHVLQRAGPDSPGLATACLAALDEAERDWMAVLSSTPSTHAPPLITPGERAGLMLMLGAEFTDAFHRRLGLVQTLAAMSPGVDESEALATAMGSLAAGKEPLLAYEAARALRRLR